ncbi:hypothetical protein K438DRAFT_195942 [Mycena galopus ATCC 62051]|nr:hypothetical protein K438DRAFT_195942 [Mycena galopus ATCC 62051]
MRPPHKAKYRTGSGSVAVKEIDEDADEDASRDNRTRSGIENSCLDGGRSERVPKQRKTFTHHARSLPLRVGVVATPGEGVLRARSDVAILQRSSPSCGARTARLKGDRPPWPSPPSCSSSARRETEFHTTPSAPRGVFVAHEGQAPVPRVVGGVVNIGDHLPDRHVGGGKRSCHVGTSVVCRWGREQAASHSQSHLISPKYRVMTDPLFLHDRRILHARLACTEAVFCNHTFIQEGMSASEAASAGALRDIPAAHAVAVAQAATAAALEYELSLMQDDFLLAWLCPSSPVEALDMRKWGSQDDPRHSTSAWTNTADNGWHTTGAWGTGAWGHA